LHFEEALGKQVNPDNDMVILSKNENVKDEKKLA